MSLRGPSATERRKRQGTSGARHSARRRIRCSRRVRPDCPGVAREGDDDVVSCGFPVGVRCSLAEPGWELRSVAVQRMLRALACWSRGDPFGGPFLAQPLRAVTAPRESSDPAPRRSEWNRPCGHWSRSPSFTRGEPPARSHHRSGFVGRLPAPPHFMRGRCGGGFQGGNPPAERRARSLASSSDAIDSERVCAGIIVTPRAKVQRRFRRVALQRARPFHSISPIPAR
jgi:hypothetical protein